MKKHHLLPNTLTPEQLGEWLKNNAVDTFKDEQKIFFSDDDINMMARQSSGAGAEIGGLKEVLKEVTDLVNNGYADDEPKTYTFYPTNGVKALDKQRTELDKQVKTGYSLDKREIYAVPDGENGMMVHFDASGNHIEERDRPFSAREKHLHMGVFGESAEQDAHSAAM